MEIEYYCDKLSLSSKYKLQIKKRITYAMFDHGLVESWRLL